jgi:hypothetical protein
VLNVIEEMQMAFFSFAWRTSRKRWVWKHLPSNIDRDEGY